MKFEKIDGRPIGYFYNVWVLNLLKKLIRGKLTIMK